MDAKNKNEELQSRRDFFKKAAKKTLPILGALILASMPTVVEASEKEAGCSWCSVGCSGNCTSCRGSCRGGCYKQCLGTCQYTCSGSCSGGCTGGCGDTCSSSSY